MNILERRLDLLRLEAKGFSKGTIVQVLAKKHKCGIRTIWYDFSKRGKWQPKLQALEEEQVLTKTLNRLEYVYHRASFYHHYGKSQPSETQTEQLEGMTIKDKLLALRIMLDATTKLYETALPDRARIKGELALTQKRPFIIQKWSREDAEARNREKMDNELSST